MEDTKQIASQYANIKIQHLAANQVILTLPYGKLLMSYESPIAFVENKTSNVFLFENWNYSRTTSKYRSQFLGETTKETEQKILSGIHIIINTKE